VPLSAKTEVAEALVDRVVPLLTARRA
jgi:hypothetical protein